MFIIGLMLLFALSLSGAAAYYSIIGLMAIFAASPIPIAVMGSILEGSKLVVASWLYRNWTDIPRLMKGYFVVALTILMFLTSMGIFGYLSKAHLDQGIPTGDVAAKVNLIDEKIKTEKENINAARQTLAQLDQQVNQTINRTTDAAGADRSVAIRRGQSKERATLTKEIESAQARVAKLNEERAPIAAELRKVEAEVGPIKYIAALIYGEEATKDPTFLEKAVRWVTILIVTVFDPLAVIMLIAANWSLANFKRKPVEEKSPEPAKVEEKLGPVQEKSPEPAKVEEKSEPEFNWRKLSYLNQPFNHFKNLKPMVYKPQPLDTPYPEIHNLTDLPEIVEPHLEKVEEAPPITVAELPEQPAEQPTESQEHPVFEPESHYWGSRPPGHLRPHDPRS